MRRGRDPFLTSLAGGDIFIGDVMGSDNVGLGHPNENVDGRKHRCFQCSIYRQFDESYEKHRCSSILSKIRCTMFSIIYLPSADVFSPAHIAKWSLGPIPRSRVVDWGFLAPL
uniref:Uncharacterized protein n=1 Tax=Cacopsylla melanoneura TaxID=428564 RepID=A0A8D8SCA9_9HEMI